MSEKILILALTFTLIINLISQFSDKEPTYSQGYMDGHSSAEKAVRYYVKNGDMPSEAWIDSTYTASYNAAKLERNK